MKRHRHAPEQVIRKLREGEKILNESKDLHRGSSPSRDLRGHLERWRNQGRIDFEDASSNGRLLNRVAVCTRGLDRLNGRL